MPRRTTKAILLATVAAVTLDSTIYTLHQPEAVSEQLAWLRWVMDFGPSPHIEHYTPRSSLLLGSTETVVASGSGWANGAA